MGPGSKAVVRGPAAQFRRRAVAWLELAAFAVEAMAIAVALTLLISFFIVRSDWLATTHEWGLFWSHYADASAGARAPVNQVLLGVLACLTLFVGACRFARARETWRAGDLGQFSRGHGGGDRLETNQNGGRGVYDDH